MKLLLGTIAGLLLAILLLQPLSAQSPAMRILGAYSGNPIGLLADSTGRLRVVDEAVGNAITVGTTAVLSGTTTRVLFDLAGLVAEDADFTFDGTATATITNLNVGGAAGVKASAADGVLTLLGMGDGNDENLTVDFDNAAANTVAIASGTGATAITATGFTITTGTVQAAYKSTDGSAGITGAACLSFKNGICVG